MKILMAGLQHETNTFSPIPATYEDFVRPDLWPKILIGTEMFHVLKDMNLPSSGFMTAANNAGHKLIPGLWCSAEPSGKVQDDAFEKIIETLATSISKNPDIDAIYLDLHGAMVTESYDDAEGELLAHIREIVGHEIPIVISLDFHANISQAMVELSNLISIYRTYPHIDMFETGERAYQYLQTWLNGGLRFKHFQQIPYLIPLSAQCTEVEPNKELFECLKNMADQQSLGIEIALGFPPSDVLDAGPSIVAYSNNEKELEMAAKALFDAAMKAENLYKDELLSPQQAIEVGLSVNQDGPIILADVQDNSGAGATSDTTGILSSMIELGVQRCLMAAICDPQLVSTAHDLGEGAEFRSTIGNHFGYDKESIKARWRVEKISNGRFTCTGEMYRGAIADVGNLALLRLIDADADIIIVVSSERFQCVDRSVFEHLGIEAEKYKFIILKSTVHFRADFEPIASKILQVESAGAHPCRLDGLDYKNLRNGVRLGPCGPVFLSEFMTNKD